MDCFIREVINVTSEDWGLAPSHLHGSASMKPVGLQFTDLRPHMGEQQVELRAGSYQKGGGVALSLWTIEGCLSEPWATLTINMPDEPALPPGCVWIKNSSENEGMVDLLISVGVLNEEPVSCCRLPFNQSLLLAYLIRQPVMTKIEAVLSAPERAKSGPSM